MSETRFTKDHEWVCRDGGIATIGITAHAQEALGDVVFVELPEPGREVGAGEACAVVESVKAASDVYAPLAGRVVETNQAIVDDPALVNRAPPARAGSSASNWPTPPASPPCWMPRPMRRCWRANDGCAGRSGGA